MGGTKNDVTGIIHLLTFQSINNLFYSFKFWGGIEIFFIPPPPYIKDCFGGGVQKNDVTEMIHLLTFKSIKNVVFFLILGGGTEIFFIPPPTLKKTLLGGYKN